MIGGLTMQFLSACAILAISAVAFVEGGSDSNSKEHRLVKREACQAPDYKCPEGFYCSYSYCRPNYRCSYHGHCPYRLYCDVSVGVCKKGERLCHSHHQCPSPTICLRGKCARKECRRDKDCAGNSKECQWPGICKEYRQRCSSQYDCKNGDWICLEGSCKKRECRADNYCKPSEKCEQPGICKPRPDYCNATNSDLCGPGQCCARPGNYPHGRCEAIKQEGEWCSVNTCPCAEGTFCKRKNANSHWGKCTAEEPGSGSGGSGDFYLEY